MTNIEMKRMWRASDVRTICIKENMYTCGDCDEYSNMLSFVSDHEPTIENLYTVAADIVDHSKYQTISNVMFILENEVVMKTFTLNGVDEF